MSTVVIAGANGPAGSAAIARLVGGGHLIAAASRTAPAAPFPETASWLSVDLTDFESTNRWLGSVDDVAGVVNLVGGWVPSPVDATTERDFDWLIDRLVKPVASTISATAAKLRERGGVYVLVSTPTAVDPNPANATHAAAKAAAESLMASLAKYFDGSSARAVTLVVNALVDDEARAKQPTRSFKGATETRDLAEEILKAIEEPNTYPNGARKCL